jgi:RHS repeat-associated protein
MLVNGIWRGSGRGSWVCGRMWVAVAAVGLLCVVAVVLAGVALALSGGAQRAASHRLPGSRASLVATRAKGDASSMARVSRLARTRWARHQRWLESPEARAERVASGMAFHGLGVGAAQGLLMRDFGSAVRKAGVVASVSRVTKAPVVRYVNPYKAEVRTQRGLAYVNSILPMAHAVDGRERPVDLALKSNGGGFAPVNAGLVIAGHLSGGVSLLSSGVGVAMEGRNVAGVLAGGSAVFFAGVAEDVDATVAPTDGGVELFATLRSRLSPQELRYRFALPSGAVLRQVAGGGVQVRRGGHVLATVLSPSARDAQGRSVPVRVVVTGDQLALRVAHRSHGFAYPILVDPEVNQEHGASAWTFQQGEVANGEFKVKSEGPFVAKEDPGGIEAPAHATYNKNPNANETARWVWQASAGMEITSVSGFDSNTAVPEQSPPDFPLYGLILAGCGGREAGYGFGEFSFTAFESNSKCPATNKLEVRYVALQLEPSYFDFTSYLSVNPIWITEAVRSDSEDYGRKNPAEPNIPRVNCDDPVNCATGNDFYTQSDMVVGGNPGLGLTRTYNSQLAATQTSHGPFGYGWMASYGAYLSLETTYCGTEVLYVCSNRVTVHQDNGSTVSFEEAGKNWAAEGSWVQATLSEKYPSESFEYTLPGGRTLVFSSTGRLTSEIGANGTTTTLTYNEKGQLTKVEEEAKRSITFAYNEEGLVKEATDPQGTVKYTYVSGNLTEVTDLAKHVWKFGYNSFHELTSQTDPRSHTVTTEYHEEKVVLQVDALERTRTWKYTATESGTETTVTNPTGAVTVEHYNYANLPTSITNAYGTSVAATTTFEYDPRYDLIAVTDPNKHTTKYEYDAAGDRTSETNPLGDKTEWTYDGLHEVATTTTPDGEKTTIKRNGQELPETISRPAPGGTQTTTYKYDAKGDLESVEDPLKRVWKYGYDSYGDRTSETDPEGNKRTWGYNEASQEISTVSPRGNATGAEPALYTTTIERDALGRPLTVTEPGSAGATGAPSNKTLATISGVAQQGQTLSAGTGIWSGAPSLTYAYQWELCNASGGSCSNVSGATSSTYVLPSGDVGDTLRVVVTASNSAGSAPSTSEATLVMSAPSNNNPVYVGEFKGTGNGQFEGPGGVAVDSKGNLWVLDTGNNRVEEFNEKDEFVRAIGSKELVGPDAVAVDSHNDVLVADTDHERIVEYNEKGEFVKAFGGLGAGGGDFENPEGITVDAHGNIWVSDTDNGLIEEFNENGEFMKDVGSGEKGSAPGDICESEGVGVDSHGNVWVADWCNTRVEVFNEKGEFVKEFGTNGSGNGQFSRPYALAINSAGLVLVGDLFDDRIEEFNEKGEFVDAFGSGGSGNGEFSFGESGFGYPMGVATDSHGDIWVADSGNNRVEEWKPAYFPANITAASISGEPILGQTLTANAGAWSGLPSLSYTYQWQRCNTTGGECSNISGATSSTHLVNESDTGTTLRVVVTATNTSDSAESTSAATGVVDAPRATKYAYDADGNLETQTDPDSNTTKYTYDADNEPIKVEEPNKTITETGYDSDGQVTSQTDGNKHTTEYVRNALEEVVEVINPLKQKTTKEYDATGNLTKVIDPLKRTTTNVYNEANELVEVTYSDGKTHSIKYEYNKDGDRTGMTDGTGTSKYTYDELDRLTETENGHKEKIKYEYDLANEQTKITYPNGKSITRAYDKDGRLEKVTDWSGNATKFRYDPDSDLATTVFPSGTSNEDKYTYTEADQMSEAKMLKGTETLASLIYARNSDGDLTSTTSKGLPGEETTSDKYDTNNRLTKSGTAEYVYSAANNPTYIATGSYNYNAADELETGPRLTYTYNETGERTKTTPYTGPATTYGYDEAGNLTSVERPKEGEISKIEDTYAYNGEALRASQTISGTTSYLTWDMAEELPLILSDGTNSYIYGPGSLPVEQINTSTGAVTYLHHDQAGSTRLLTGSTGTVTGKCTYSAYGTPTCEGTSTTPLGYDAQYTSTDTGLIYMRARVYDPATAQFLSVDPLEAITREPYNYVGDNPLNASDPTGLLFGIKLPSAEEVGEGIAAWGDTVTLGATKWIREELGDNNVNTCSTAYQAGEYTGLATAVLIPGEDDIEVGLQFTEDQDALIQLAKEADRAGELTPEDAEALKEWSEEYGLNFRGPEIHPNRNFNIYHVHVGPVSHIPTSIGPIQP